MTGSNSGITVTRDDARYDALRQGFNQRWVATPDYIKVVRSADEVVNALNKALKEKEQGRKERSRITVRSGGHCYEDFVSSPDVRVIIDVSLMDKVYFDPEMDAYCVEAGATNWHIYTHLYRQYGVTLPAGSCYSVGAGGHICAGGYGLLSRQYGLTVDYLFAVEVVVARDKRAEKVLARRDSQGDLHDLWWAHTGGGGGNFGIVTRYWFKDPRGASKNPELLPKPPKHVWLSAITWEWERSTKTASPGWSATTASSSLTIAPLMTPTPACSRSSSSRIAAMARSAS
jgi:FAD/FMN-containing dehydrogenase